MSNNFTGKNGLPWSSKPPKRPPLGNFDYSKAGVSQSCRGIKTPKEAFLAFLSPDIIQEVVHCTNLYGKKYYEQRNRKTAWRQVTCAEMRAFIAVLIAAGRNNQNHINVQQLWSSNSFWRIGFYGITISKNRFCDIYTCLRFDDTSTRPERFANTNDKLEPIKKVTEMFVTNCMQNYVPSNVLTVDERLCLFRGRFFF